MFYLEQVFIVYLYHFTLLLYIFIAYLYYFTLVILLLQYFDIVIGNLCHILCHIFSSLPVLDVYELSKLQFLQNHAVAPVSMDQNLLLTICTSWYASCMWWNNILIWTSCKIGTYGKQLVCHLLLLFYHQKSLACWNHMCWGNGWELVLNLHPLSPWGWPVCLTLFTNLTNNISCPLHFHDVTVPPV